MFSADQLLEPIQPDAPSGEDMAFSSDLDAIGQARKFDDPSLDQGEWVTEIKEADWDFVVTRCAALLERRTKDLRLAVWLTEAGAKSHHLRGLGEGLRLLAGLCDRFWGAGLYPESDGADHDQRIGNLSWILARVPQLVREVPLTEGRGSAYSSVDFEAARRQAARSDDSGAATTLAAMEAARSRNSARFIAQFSDEARACMDALLDLERAADARLGMDSPGFSAAKDALETMLRAMPAAAVASAPVAAVVVPDAAAADTIVLHAAAPAQALHAGPPGAPQNRAQALAQLRQVAEFFRRTEPHSPVSYFADKAADAGEQDLVSWLRSVVKDSGSMSHIEEMLGVPASE